MPFYFHWWCSSNMMGKISFFIQGVPRELTWALMTWISGVPLSARLCLNGWEFGRSGWATGQYGGTQISKSTQPRSQLTWDTLYFEHILFGAWFSKLCNSNILVNDLNLWSCDWSRSLQVILSYFDLWSKIKINFFLSCPTYSDAVETLVWHQKRGARVRVGLHISTLFTLLHSTFPPTFCTFCAFQHYTQVTSCLRRHRCLSRVFYETATDRPRVIFSRHYTHISLFLTNFILCNLDFKSGVRGGPTEFCPENGSILNTVWETYFYFQHGISQTTYGTLQFPV